MFLVLAEDVPPIVDRVQLELFRGHRQQIGIDPTFDHQMGERPGSLKALPQPLDMVGIKQTSVDELVETKPPSADTDKIVLADRRSNPYGSFNFAHAPSHIAALGRCAKSIWARMELPIHALMQSRARLMLPTCLGDLISRIFEE